MRPLLVHFGLGLECGSEISTPQILGDDCIAVIAHQQPGIGLSRTQFQTMGRKLIHRHGVITYNIQGGDRARSSVMPPMATSGMSPIFFFHSPIRAKPCGAKGIFFKIVG